MTGPTILLTRPRAASEQFATQIRARRPAVEIVIAPVIEIEPVGALVDPSPWPTVVFTSANGVARAPNGDGTLAYCVGDTTAACARDAGYTAVSADGTADDLIQRLLQDAPATPVLHIRGAHGASLADALTARGLETREQVTYRQVDRELSTADLSRIASAKHAIAPVFSPRSASRLRACLGPMTGLTVVAISPAAAKAWGGHATIAARPTGEAMQDAVVAAVDSDSPYPA